MKAHGLEPIKLDIFNEKPQGMWDVMYASAVFLHFTMDDFRLALNNIHQALHTGGILAFTVIEGEGELTKDERLGLPRYFKYYTQEELQSLLNEARFGVSDLRATEHGNKTWLYITANKI